MRVRSRPVDPHRAPPAPRPCACVAAELPSDGRAVRHVDHADLGVELTGIEPGPRRCPELRRELEEPLSRPERQDANSTDRCVRTSAFCAADLPAVRRNRTGHSAKCVLVFASRFDKA